MSGRKHRDRAVRWDGTEMSAAEAAEAFAPWMPVLLHRKAAADGVVGVKPRSERHRA